MSAGDGAVVYKEVQRWGTVPALIGVAGALVISAAVVVPMGWGTVQQLVLGRPMGDRPLPDGVLAIVGPMAVLLALVPWVILTLTLTVEVSAHEVLVRMDVKGPIRLVRPRRIPIAEVVGAEIGSELPLGWGMSRTLGRVSYRVNGNEGVELTLRSGLTVFIGSARPRELLSAIRARRV